MAKKKRQEEPELEEIHDNYNILADWMKLKSMVLTVDEDIQKIVRKKGVRATIRARSGLSEIRKICTFLRQSVFLQKQDNRSNYEDRNREYL